jgi:DNA-binding MarR family transcriptional regulator
MNPLPTEPELPAAFEPRLALLLHKLGQLVFDRSLAGREYVTLALLAADRPRSQQEIAASLDCVPGVVVGVVDQLEAQGLAQRERSPEDRRRSVVSLTDKGRATLAAADELGERIVVDLLAELSGPERAAFEQAVGTAVRRAWRDWHAPAISAS